VLFTGVVILAGGFLMSYQLGTEFVVFGAFIAFMGVNAAAALHAFRESPRSWLDCALPALGFVICFAIWASLRWPVLLGGAVWLTAGALYGAYKTNGFRRRIAFAEAGAE